MTRPMDTVPPPYDRAVSDLVRLAQQATDAGLTPRENAGLVRFEQTVAARTLRGSGRAKWYVGLTFAAAAAGAAVFVMQPRSSALTFSVVNGTVSDGGYVQAAAAGGTELRFSDGSNLELAPGTSSRVTDLGPNGSRVFLESGHARVRVTHRPHAKWTIDAGPYSVRVVGTEFDVRWSGTEQVFDVHLHKGSVIVTGPLASRGLTMEAGQHLVANVREGEIFLDRTEAEGAETSAEASPARDVPRPALADPRARALPPRAAHVRPVAPATAPHAAAETTESWAKRVAAGDFHGVLAEAERRGIESTLGSASASELFALADAARYVRRTEVARRALLAERDRFPRSREGREAAFFLGGLSEDDSGASASKSALDWYDRYLAENPRGAYAPHALGRQMVLVHKLRGAAAARPIAVDYLERFPSGPYAAPARKLVE
jgi:hypothetical protein